jgi:hypothetical protein
MSKKNYYLLYLRKNHCLYSLNVLRWTYTEHRLHVDEIKNSHLLVIFDVNSPAVVDASRRRRDDDEVKQNFKTNAIQHAKTEKNDLRKSFDSHLLDLQSNLVKCDDDV